MPRARLRLFPDPVLRQKARPVERFDGELLKWVETLDETMRSQPSGIGIAAPQIGCSLRLALVDVSARVRGAERLVLANPEILQGWDEKISREGCMSLPDYTGSLKRYGRVATRWQDETGRWHEKTSRGIEAVCIQHEIDHLNGLLFLDRIAFLKRDLVPRPRRFGPRR